MGCGSTHLRIEGEIIKQETIQLDLNEHYKSKELTQAQALIHLITNIRNKIIYEYDNLIYISGACLFKNPSMIHCTKCILFKISSECEGDLTKAKLSFREDPPFMKIDFNFKSPDTNIILSQFFEFIVRLRDYKILIKQIDKETPKLMYILYENNNKVSKENLEKINKGILLFKDLTRLRGNILVQYKNQIYELASNNTIFINQINKIGEIAYKKNIKDIYEIIMLLKDISDDKESENNLVKEEWVMYNNIKEAKRIMEKKLEKEKVEEIDSSLLTFSLKRSQSYEDFKENNIIFNNN